MSEDWEARKKFTLYINVSNSRCGNCNRGCDPRSQAHNIVYEYSKDSGKIPGCGIVWLYVASDYVGLNMKERCAEFRPDLIWNGYDEELWMNQNNQK